ncbi:MULTISPECIES: hypothetical protein [Sorangium]
MPPEDGRPTTVFMAPDGWVVTSSPLIYFSSTMSARNVWYARNMTSYRRVRSAAEILRSVPPRDRARMLRFGLDLDDPADAALFVSGVRAADDGIAAQERWERENALR